MLRQAAFIADNKMLKGGLHCHTTRSDGDCTPEEIMKLHKEHGYDFLALRTTGSTITKTLPQRPA